MQNKNKLAQIMMIAGSAIFLSASGVLASLSIETNMENAVQTIRKVIVTSDGTASGDVLIELNPDGAEAGNTEMFKVRGRLLWEIFFIFLRRFHFSNIQ